MFHACVCIIIISGCAKERDSKSNQKQEDTHTKRPYADAKIEIKTFSTADGWGYDIYVWDSVYIHQQHRPAVPGNRGFNTEKEAQKVAEVVVRKMRKNEIPPTVTVDEMKNLGVLK